jgi:hypothetical protein
MTPEEFMKAASVAGLTTKEAKAALEIAKKESNLRPSAKNSKSSAAGLFGQMQSVHGKVSPCAVQQIRWADKYATSRYGGWSRAAAARRKKGWW